VGWRLRIVHHTGFQYAGQVRSSYNEARLTPLTLPTQTTLDARVVVHPTASTWTYWDYWGSQVTAFDLHEEHDVLEVVGTSVVETEKPRPLADPLGWEALADARTRDRLIEMLRPTPRTDVGPDLAEVAHGLTAGRTPHDAACAVADWVADTMSYAPGSTEVQTSAREAYQQRQGVCQDLAHLAVGMLRSLGVPARYVSGYLHPVREAEVGGTVEGQSHAWVEWWVGGWVGHDPTNGAPAGEHHVVVARGRDYDDVPPLKGIYRGAPSSTLGVSVEVTRLA
jgi:transglutaminase-like putative cysteine protease